MNKKLRIAFKVIGLFALAVFVQSVLIPSVEAMYVGALELNVYFGAALVVLIPLALGGYWLYREYKKASEESDEEK